jgi:cysteine synthase
VLNIELIDQIITVGDNDQLAKGLGQGKRILVIAPDGVDKYMSTELFA